jgi:hypothetical protein
MLYALQHPLIHNPRHASLKHMLIYTDNPKNSMLDDVRGIRTSKLEEEYVEGAPSMALVAVFSACYSSGIEFSK